MARGETAVGSDRPRAARGGLTGRGERRPRPPSARPARTVRLGRSAQAPGVRSFVSQNLPPSPVVLHLPPREPRPAACRCPLLFRSRFRVNLSGAVPECTLVGLAVAAGRPLRSPGSEGTRIGRTEARAGLGSSAVGLGSQLRARENVGLLKQPADLAFRGPVPASQVSQPLSRKVKEGLVTLQRKRSRKTPDAKERSGQGSGKRRLSPGGGPEESGNIGGSSRNTEGGGN